MKTGPERGVWCEWIGAERGAEQPQDRQQIAAKINAHNAWKQQHQADLVALRARNLARATGRAIPT